MAVATKEDVVLKLSNGECIPNDHKVRRIKVYGKKGNEPRRYYDHPGVSRRICHFKLKTMGWHGDYTKETEGGRVAKVITRSLSRLRKMSRKSGFGDDFVQNYRKKREDDSDSGEGENVSDNKV